MLPSSQPAILLTFEVCIRGHSEYRLMASLLMRAAVLCLLTELVISQALRSKLKVVYVTTQICGMTQTQQPTALEEQSAQDDTAGASNDAKAHLGPCNHYHYWLFPDKDFAAHPSFHEGLEHLHQRD